MGAKECEMIVNINNSFSIFAENDFCIWMDPWLDSANYGSWSALYEPEDFKTFVENSPYPFPDLVYISHLHTDHYDINFLNFLKNYFDLKIVIKDFKDGRLKKRITDEVNPSEILCLKEYEYFEFKSAKLMIVPQVSASSAETENQLEYDLDTSLIIETSDTLLFNEVDNPLHVEDYLNEVLPLSNWNTNGDKTRIGLIGYSGASDYPQSYLGIDRLNERKKIIDKTLDRFWTITKLLSLDYVIPAGGTFILDGNLDNLNQYTPVPKHHEIVEKSKGSSILLNPLAELMKFNNGVWLVENRSDSLERLPSVKRTEDFFEYKEYDSTQKDNLVSLQSEIEKKMPERLVDLFSKLETQIKFILHETDPLFEKIENGLLPVCDELMVFERFAKEKTINLNIHLHWQMLLQMMNGELVWNELTFHCIYNRVPNKYEPDAMFALNLYKSFSK